MLKITTLLALLVTPVLAGATPSKGVAMRSDAAFTTLERNNLARLDDRRTGAGRGDVHAQIAAMQDAAGRKALDRLIAGVIGDDIGSGTRGR